MRVDHIVPDIEKGSAGPAQSVPAMCNGLVDAGVDVTLHVLGSIPADGRFKFNIANYPRSSWPIRAVGRSPSMLKALKKRASAVDIIHNHSLWMCPNIYPGWAVKGTRCKLVCAPRGTLTPYSLARSVLKKKIMWYLGQRSMMQGVDMFHATAEGELADIRRLGYRQPVMVLPNGISLPDSSLFSPKRSLCGGGCKTLIYLSRIHPEKRIDLLLRAWQRLEPLHPDWKLDIYGPLDGKFPQQMQGLAQDLNLSRATFKGEVCGEAKFKVLHDADLFVLPTHTENFGMAIAEALASGTPVITTTGAPWKDLECNRCGWWIDETLDAVSETLDKAMRLSCEELAGIGNRGREWMKRDFDWNRLGVKMKAAYEWLLGQGEKPEWVRVD